MTALRTAADVTIRSAGAPDAAHVAALLTQLVGTDVSADAAAARLAALSATGHDGVFLAERNGTPLGLVALHWGPQIHRTPLTARIVSLVVTEAARGQGVGAMLLDHCETIARAQGCGVMELTSDAGRTDAHRFYRRHGYDGSSIRFRKQLA